MVAVRIDPQLAIPRALVGWEPSEHPVLSCYVDWRVSGRGLHEALTIVRKELHTTQGQLPERGPARESFDADFEHILTYLEHDADRAAHGIAIFACHGRGLWWTISLGVPVPTRIHTGTLPRLLPLAEVTQEAVRTLVALVDTNDARLISLDRGGEREAPGPHRDHWKSVHHSNLGGWSQANYQRSVDTMIDRFASDIADAIAEHVTAEQLDRVVLAGDRVITGPVLNTLNPQLRKRVGAIERVDVRAPLEQVAERVWPQVRAVAERDRDAEVQRLIDLAGADRAFTDPARIREQLLAGRIFTLVIDPDAVDDDAAEFLLREALLHRSRVIVSRGSAPLAGVGGLVASLR
jgi:release factor family 10